MSDLEDEVEVEAEGGDAGDAEPAAAAAAAAAAAGAPPRRPKSKADRAPLGDCVPSQEPCDPEDRKAFEERSREQDARLVSPFMRRKFEADAADYWDKFYKRNETRFFKNRYYIGRLFEELKPFEAEPADPAARATLLEVGCGVGNTMFPLLQDYPGLNVIGFDFSPRAVAMIKQRPEFDPRRCDAWVGDIVREGVTLPAPYRERGGVDFATLLFVLSAMAPEEHLLALRNVAAALKPGGVLFIRDYAVYDLAQLRFKKGAKIAENYYVRWDGTRSYFFDRDTLQRLLAAAGFEVLANFYHRKVVRNVKKNLAMKRVWCQVRARRLPGALPPPPQP